MSYYHGVKASKKATSVSTPVVAGSGIHFIVGTAPVHSVGGAVNEPVLCYSYAEAVSAMGYSDDWEKYDICEEIYTAFMLYSIAPVIMVNVLDPEKHISEESAKDFTLSSGKTDLPFEAIADQVEVKGYESHDTGYDTENILGETYKRGEDYELIYTDGVLRLERIEGGKITSESAMLNIKYKAVDPSKVTKADIIGGYDTNTKKNKGFELIDSVFPKFRIVPDLLLAPRFSGDSEVAAIMATKAENINGLFVGKALIDADTSAVTRYTEVPEWKNTKNITQPTQLLGWPMFKLGDRVFHHSTQLAARITATDLNDDMGGGSPCESASNKTLQIDGMVLADGTEVLLDLTQANYLNSNGIITGLNLTGGYVSWGNETACYPSNTDVTDYFYCVSRMFGWVANSVILSTWSKIDRKLIRRLIESIVDSFNIWLNGLMAEEKILGGRIEFTDSENPDTDLMAGIVKFHIYLTPPSPAKEFDFVLEYDTSYLDNLFA